MTAVLFACLCAFRAGVKKPLVSEQIFCANSLAFFLEVWYTISSAAVDFEIAGAMRKAHYFLSL